MSPLLFALALEPLAARIRASPYIVGFRQSHKEDKISLYADDALLYLGDTTGSLIAAIWIIELFGEFSGFAINWHKSMLIPLDDLPSALPDSVSKIQVVF